MTEDKSKPSIFNPEGIRSLLEEGGGKELNDDERALVLALVAIETETGRTLSEEELAAVEKLKSQVESYDPEALVQAVKHIVTSQARDGEAQEWPELKEERRKHRSAEE
jgi:hypothetical protein